MPFCNMCEQTEDDPIVSYTSYKLVGSSDTGPRVILCRTCQQEQTNKARLYKEAEEKSYELDENEDNTEIDEILNINWTCRECMICNNDSVGPKSRFYFFINNDRGGKDLNWICRGCNSNFENPEHFVRYWNNQENIFSRKILRIAKKLVKRCIDVNENGQMVSSIMIDHEITSLIRFSLRSEDGAIRREFMQRVREAIQLVEQRGDYY
jgi:hypothetical protein